MYANSLLRTMVRLTLLFTTVSLASGVYAVGADTHQREHPHAAPHGGQMVTAGKHHLEIVVKDHQEVQVYLYDDNSRLIPVPVQQATLYLRLPGNKRQTLTLEAKGSGTASYLTTTADLHDVHTFDAALRIALDGEVRNLRFTYQEDDDGAQHKHAPGR